MKVELSACESSIANSRLDTSEVNRKKSTNKPDALLQTIISQEASELEVPDFDLKEFEDPRLLSAEDPTLLTKDNMSEQPSL